mgnify:CR=1 FL=1
MLELTKETFEPEVLNAEGTVFVDFYMHVQTSTATR